MAKGLRAASRRGRHHGRIARVSVGEKTLGDAPDGVRVINAGDSLDICPVLRDCPLYLHLVLAEQFDYRWQGVDGRLIKERYC